VIQTIIQDLTAYLYKTIDGLNLYVSDSEFNTDIDFRRAGEEIYYVLCCLEICDRIVSRTLDYSGGHDLVKSKGESIVE
jgi:hypothetical protein